MMGNDYTDKAEKYSKSRGQYSTVDLAYSAFRTLILRYVVDGKYGADIGCGSGRSRKFLEGMGIDAFGFDISQSMLETARKQDPNALDRYQLIQNGQIPDRAAKYDLAFSTLVVLEISTKKAMFEYFQEAYRVMKFGGTMIVMTVNDDFYQHDWLSIDTDFPENKQPKIGDKVRIRLKAIDLELVDYYWTREDYKQAIAIAGFSIVEEVQPKADLDDDRLWLSEKMAAPYVIFVLKKTRACLPVADIAKRKNMKPINTGRGFFEEPRHFSHPPQEVELLQPEIFQVLFSSEDNWSFQETTVEQAIEYREGNDLIAHVIDENGSYAMLYIGIEHEQSIKSVTVPEGVWLALEMCGSFGHTCFSISNVPEFSDAQSQQHIRKLLLDVVNKDDGEVLKAIDHFVPFDKRLVPSPPSISSWPGTFADVQPPQEGTNVVNTDQLGKPSDFTCS